MESMMESMDKLKALVVKELDKIVAKGDLSETELKNANHALDVVEKICHIERGEDFDKEYSGRGYYIQPSHGWDDYSRNSYPGDNSYARGRNMRTGQYMSRDGYSGDNEYTIRNLEMLMNDTQTEHERRMLNDCINRIKAKM